MKMVITGGGSGGHIFPGVAIAQEFLNMSKANDVIFVGSEYGLENKLVPRTGIKLKTLKIGQLVGKSLLRKFLTLLELPIAILKCISVLRKFKADFVVAVGGYAAGPCVIAAKLCGIPLGVLEQNAILGFTNKISSKLATFVFTSFDEIPNGVSASKCIFTGNPSRSGMKPNFQKSTNPFTIFVFGGSQGARGINRMILETAKELLPFKEDIKIIHQTGDKNFDEVKKAYEEIGFPAEIHPFIHDMQAMYNKANLVICRAGSATISELGATQSASLLIPFPFSAGNHQVHNAELIKKKNAGLMLEETNEKGILTKIILELKNNPEKLKEYSQNIVHFYKPDAANRILTTMISYVLKKA